MKMSVGQLREEIQKILRGSQPEESYDKELADDPSFNKDSVYVPNWAKKKIKTWMKDMKLSTK